MADAERFPHKPLITELRNVTVQLGEAADMECRVISDLAPFIQWYKHSADANGSYINTTTGLPYGDMIQVRPFFLFVLPHWGFVF